MTSTEMKNTNIKYDEFAFEISGIAENRIWDPDGSATSTLITQLFPIKIHIFICHSKINATISHMTQRLNKNSIY